MVYPNQGQVDTASLRGPRPLQVWPNVVTGTRKSSPRTRIAGISTARRRHDPVHAPPVLLERERATGEVEPPHPRPADPDAADDLVPPPARWASVGTYDAVVSVEMIEAVGEEFWPEYFATLARVLAPGGKIGLQAITMPHDRLRVRLPRRAAAVGAGDRAAGRRERACRSCSAAASGRTTRGRCRYLDVWQFGLRSTG
jgi:hypothetical protein